MGLASPDVLELHRRACDGFGAVVGEVGDRWNYPSPCSEWDARGVLEHVIGFHDVLVLVPLGAKPARPKDDPVARWGVTAEALNAVTAPDAVVPERARADAAGLARLLPLLFSDVLVHTWDLAAAVGIDVVLASDLCEVALAGARKNEERLRSSGMFVAPVEVPAGVDAQTALMAFMGRDPAWGRS